MLSESSLTRTEPSRHTQVVSLRTATVHDRDLLLEWRNDPLTRRFAFNPAEVAPDEHAAWFARVMRNEHVAIFVAEERGAPVGQVRLERTGTDDAEVHIVVAPGARGRGLASELLGGAAREAARGGIERLSARVLETNGASLRAFARAGFREVARADGVVQLELAFDTGASCGGDRLRQ
jgi:RimJ/RimL family protein N-acetyltransferase